MELSSPFSRFTVRLAIWLLAGCGLIVGLLAVPAVGEARTDKVPRLTVAQSATGRIVHVSGSVRQPGLKRRSSTASVVVLEERVGPAGKRVRWVRRAQTRIARRPGRSNHFRMHWKVRRPIDKGAKVELRVRALRGKHSIAKPEHASLMLRAPAAAAPATAMTTFVPRPKEVIVAPPPDQEGTLVLRTRRVLKPGSAVAVTVGKATPDGFLGEVVSSTVRGKRTVVQTKPVSLMEVVPNASFDVSADDLRTTEDTSPEESELIRALTGGPAIRPAAINRLIRNAEPEEPVPAKRAQGSCGPSLEFTVEHSLGGSIGTDFNLNWWAKWPWEQPPVGAVSRATATLTLSDDVALTGKGKVGCSATIALLPGPLRLAPITFSVGPVPIVLVPEVNIYIALSADLSGGMTATIHSRLAFTAGIQYDDGNVSPVFSANPSISLDPNSVAGTMNLTASATVGPMAGMKLYGIIGPYANVMGGIRLNMDFVRPPWIVIDALIEANAGIEIGIWPISISAGLPTWTKSWPIYTIEKPPPN